MLARRNVLQIMRIILEFYFRKLILLIVELRFLFSKLLTYVRNLNFQKSLSQRGERDGCSLTFLLHDRVFKLKVGKYNYCVSAVESVFEKFAKVKLFSDKISLVP